MRILSLNGLLGYGYSEVSLRRSIDSGIDCIGVDAGSTDPGPHYLGSGTSFTNRDAVRRDTALVLPWAVRNRVPLIIGTAGGSGADIHLQWMQDILEEIAAEHGLRFRMAVIRTEVTAGYVIEKLRAGKIRELGPGLALSEEQIRRCTVQSVAAHTMYEQGNPYRVFEPDGTAELAETRYEQISERAVRVSGSRFVRAAQAILKLEGSMPAGFRTIAPACIRDPSTILAVDRILQTAKDFVAEDLKGKAERNDYTILLHRSGEPLDGKGWRGRTPDCSLGLLIEVTAKTQELADTVCALVRARMLHTDYPGRRSTAGNLAFPYSPSDIHCGPVYTFGIYHLAEVADPCETARISVTEAGTHG